MPDPVRILAAINFIYGSCAATIDDADMFSILQGTHFGWNGSTF